MTRLVLLFLFALLFAPSPLLAQDGFVRISEAQRQLNEEGTRMAAQGEHEQAVKLFESSLALEEINVTYLNLGRSLALLGRCEEAVVAYDQVLTVGKVKSPSPAMVEEALQSYRADLATQCDGFLQLACSDPAIRLSFDGASPIPCSDQPVALKPGAHLLEASTPWGARSAFELDVQGMQTRKVQLELAPAPTPERVVEQVPVPVSEPPGADSLLLWGGLAAGLGSALLVSALCVDLLVLTPVNDAYEAAGVRGDSQSYEALRAPLDDIQPLNQALVISGGVLLAGGVTLIALELAGVFGDTTSLEAPQAWLSPDGAGLLWSTQW